MKGSCTFPSSWLKGLSLHEVPQDWEMLTSEPLKARSFSPKRTSWATVARQAANLPSPPFPSPDSLGAPLPHTHPALGRAGWAHSQGPALSLASGWG